MCTSFPGAQGHFPTPSPLLNPNMAPLLHSADKETEAEVECNLPEVHMSHSRTRPSLLASASGFSHRHLAAATCFIDVPAQLPFSGSCLVMKGMSDSLFPTCNSSLSKTLPSHFIPHTQSCWFSAFWWPISEAGPHRAPAQPTAAGASSSPVAPAHPPQPPLPGFDSPQIQSFLLQPRVQALLTSHWGCDHSQKNISKAYKHVAFLLKTLDRSPVALKIKFKLLVYKAPHG